MRELWGDPQGYGFDDVVAPLPQRVAGCLVALDRKHDVARLHAWLRQARHRGEDPLPLLRAAWQADRSLPAAVTA